MSLRRFTVTFLGLGLRGLWPAARLRVVDGDNLAGPVELRAKLRPLDEIELTCPEPIATLRCEGLLLRRRSVLELRVIDAARPAWSAPQVELLPGDSIVINSPVATES